MFRSEKTGLLLTALLLLQYSFADAGNKVSVESITPYFAKYDLKRGGMKLATVNYALWKDGDTYIYETSGDARGVARLIGGKVAREEARFMLVDGKIRQQSYSYIYDNGADKRNRTIIFDWDNHKVTVNRRGKTRQFPLKDGMVDRLVLQLKVVLDMANSRLQPHYTAIAKRKPTTYDFVKDRTETVATPAGNFRTVVITGTQKSRKGDRLTRYWCAEELFMLPVKIEQYRNGEGPFEMVLVSVRGLK